VPVCVFGNAHHHLFVFTVEYIRERYTCDTFVVDVKNSSYHIVYTRAMSQRVPRICTLSRPLECIVMKRLRAASGIQARILYIYIYIGVPQICMPNEIITRNKIQHRFVQSIGNRLR
jgi:hypothetical protein